MSGLILPAGSPLVQFELTGFPHGGGANTDLPVQIIVNRFPTKIPCPAGKPCFEPHLETEEYRISAALPGHRPVVCLCMGRFIE